MVIYFVSEVHRDMSSNPTISSPSSSIQPPLAISSSPMTVPVTASVATPSRSSSILGTLGSLGSLGLASSVADSSSSVSESDSFLSSPIFIGITVIIALALAGFSVFSYLGTGADDLTSRALQILRFIAGYLSSFMNKFTDNTVTGTKGAVDVAGGTVKAGAAIPNDLVNGSATKGTVVSQQNKKKIDTTSVASADLAQPEQSASSNDLQDKLDGATVQSQGQNQNKDEPEAAATKSSGPGYCYIGDDRGARSCISVSESTKCMSGDVYPNLDVCQRAP